MTKERFLTKGWNNLITVGVGLIVVVYAILFYPAMEETDWLRFIGMVVLGVVY